MTDIKLPGWLEADTVEAGTKMRRGPTQYFHWCPGCEEFHPLPDGWTFNGNLESPTFSPSFKHTINNGKAVCHYILTAGQLNFCGDCTHDLAGQSVPLPMLPKDYPA